MLLEMIHVGTQDPLHDIGLGVVNNRMLTPKDLCVVIILC
jgi:hypothetical protein